MDKNLIFSKNFLFLASQLLFGTYKKVLTTFQTLYIDDYQCFPIIFIHKN